MHFNTLKSVGGYLVSLLERLSGFSFKDNRIEAIYNYHRLPFGLYTSGQPTAGQFESIKQAGVETVINLAPANAENALANEAELWADMGMHYQHMPVDFSNPTEQDFARFCALLESQQLNRIWLHCAANMRVSAFVFRYRCEILGHERKDAERDLNKIWQPIGVWKKFVAVNK